MCFYKGRSFNTHRRNFVTFKVQLYQAKFELAIVSKHRAPVKSPNSSIGEPSNVSIFQCSNDISIRINDYTKGKIQNAGHAAFFFETVWRCY